MIGVSVLFAVWVAQVSGHGNMVYPPVFQDFQKIGLDLGRAYKGHGGFIGCGRNDPKNGVDNSCVLQWYSNFTRVPKGQPMTLPENMRAFKINQVDRRQGLNPWYAPGTAEVFSPCGSAGGNPEGCPRGRSGKNNCPGGGHSQGAAAEEYYANRNIPMTTWPKGSVQNVGFTLSANHGGGYQYRICKVPAGGRAGVTEECFQKMPLKFHCSKHRIAFNSKESTWKSYPARDTNIGTKPAGSTWRRNPIPACDGGAGGFFSDNSCPRGTQFPAPAPGLHGFSITQKDPRLDNTFKFAVVDQVKVPDDIEEGEYVLSWRWDNEQTPQIWNTCSGIKVTAKSGSAVPQCSESDGSGESDGEGENCPFKRENNVAYWHGDLVDGKKNRVDSADICEQQCKARADCLGFSYAPDNMGDYSRTCWLKKNLDDRRDGDEAKRVISGVRVRCDDSDGSDGSDDSDGEGENCPFKRENDIGYWNGDLVDGMKNRVDSADICEQQCKARADCLGFSYAPENMGDFSRTCWLKKNLDDRREAGRVISGVRRKCENSDGSADKIEAAYKKGYKAGYENGFEKGYAKGKSDAENNDADKDKRDDNEEQKEEEEKEEEEVDGNVLKPTKANLLGKAEGTNMENAYDGDVKTWITTTTKKKAKSRMFKLWLEKIHKIKSITLKLWFYNDELCSQDNDACLKEWAKLKGVTASVWAKKKNTVCGKVQEYDIPDISETKENTPAVSVTLECPGGAKGKEIRVYPEGDFGDLLISEVEVQGHDSKVQLLERDENVEHANTGEEMEPIKWEHGNIYNGELLERDENVIDWDYNAPQRANDGEEKEPIQWEHGNVYNGE